MNHINYNKRGPCPLIFRLTNICGLWVLIKQVRRTGLFKLQQKLKEVKALSKVWAMEKGQSSKLSIARTELEGAVRALEADATSAPYTITHHRKREKSKGSDQKRGSSP